MASLLVLASVPPGVWVCVGGLAVRDFSLLLPNDGQPSLPAHLVRVRFSFLVKCLLWSLLIPFARVFSLNIF